MSTHQVSPTGLLLLLSAGTFLTNVAVLMLGPLFVTLAHGVPT